MTNLPTVWVVVLLLHWRMLRNSSSYLTDYERQVQERRESRQKFIAGVLIAGGGVLWLAALSVCLSVVVPTVFRSVSVRRLSAGTLCCRCLSRPSVLDFVVVLGCEKTEAEGDYSVLGSAGCSIVGRARAVD